MGDFLLKKVKIGLAIGTVTKETNADAFPVAATHREGVAGWEIGLAIGTIEVLVTILLTVVGDFKIETCEGARLDNGTLAVFLDENALFAETDASKQLARTEESGITVTFRLDDRRALTQIAYNLLSQHVTTSFQTVGRQGIDGEEPLSLQKTPVGIVGIVIPLPGELQIRGGRSEKGGVGNVEIVDEIG